MAPGEWMETSIARVEREEDFEACFAAFFPNLALGAPATAAAVPRASEQGGWSEVAESEGFRGIPGESPRILWIPCSKKASDPQGPIPLLSLSIALLLLRPQRGDRRRSENDQNPSESRRLRRIQRPKRSPSPLLPTFVTLPVARPWPRGPKTSTLAANVVCARSFVDPFGGASTSSSELLDDEKSRAFWNPEGAEMPPTSTVAGVDLYDFNKKLVSVCAACQRQITDRFILRVHPNLEFHAACLKCQKCFQPLDEKCTAFVRNGETYCRDDYLSLFGTKCVRCERVFDRQDLVMRARNLVFHVNCFTCYSCDRHLAPGEEYVVKEDELYCRHDCDSLNAEPSSTKTADMFARDDDECWDTSTLASLDNHATPPLSVKSPKSQEMPTPGYPLHNSSSSSTGSGGSKKSKKDKQTTRVRTVLNENQLRMLKACYAQNSRPDAIEKERLVEMTGLTARVIRVWFQNKRCKDKKRQVEMKSRMVAAEKDRTLNNVRLHGIGPLVASSPANHHDQHLAGIAPLEIHHFPQNPALWEPQLGADALPPYPPNMMNGFEELSGFGMPPPPGGFYGASPHLSSPSCSE
uniref:Homeobox domain-containing protein n=1 Tax=Steinernema glaseri TaxID=37863 RepID=A0A1I7YJQ0_9BILA